MANLIDIMIRLSKGGTGAAEAAKELQGIQREAAATATRMKELGSSMTRIGTGLTVGVTAPIVAMGLVAVKAASDTSESWNKVTAVFGTNANVIKNFAANSATSLAMTRAQAYDATSAFGAMFQALGVGAGDTLRMSEGLTQLATDMASFNNISTADALEKLRSGMAGEVEPLRQYGVSLSEAAVKTEAYRMGLARSGTELNEQQKVLARYSLLMSMTTVQQGDHARTSGELAGQMRILQAEIGNLAAQFGTNLLPMAKQVLTSLNQLAIGFNNLGPGVQQAVVYVGMLAAVAGPVTSGVGLVIKAIGGLIGAFSALSAASAAAWVAAIPPVAIVAGMTAATVAVLAYSKAQDTAANNRAVDAAYRLQDAKMRLADIQAEPALAGTGAEEAAKRELAAAQEAYDSAMQVKRAFNDSATATLNMANANDVGTASFMRLAAAAKQTAEQTQASANAMSSLAGVNLTASNDTGALRGGGYASVTRGAEYAQAQATDKAMSAIEERNRKAEAAAKEAEQQKVTAAQTAAQKIVSAFDGLAGRVSSSLSGIADTVRSLVPSLFPGGGGMWAPGANSSVENVYRAADIAKQGGASPWASQGATAGMSQEQAKNVVRLAGSGNFMAPEVAGLIDWKKYGQEIMTQQQTENLNKYQGQAIAGLLASGKELNAESIKSAVNALAAKAEAEKLTPANMQAAVSTLGGGTTLAGVVDAIKGIGGKAAGVVINGLTIQGAPSETTGQTIDKLIAAERQKAHYVPTGAMVGAPG